MATIREDTSPLAAVHFSLRGGRFRVSLRGLEPYHMRRGIVLDDEDNMIGTANDLIYGARGFSVWTKPFAGFVPNEQIEFVE